MVTSVVADDSCDGAAYTYDTAAPPSCWDTCKVKTMADVFREQATCNPDGIGAWQTHQVIFFFYPKPFFFGNGFGNPLGC